MAFESFFSHYRPPQDPSFLQSLNFRHEPGRLSRSTTALLPYRPPACAKTLFLYPRVKLVVSFRSRGIASHAADENLRSLLEPLANRIISFQVYRLSQNVYKQNDISIRRHGSSLGFGCTLRLKRGARINNGYSKPRY
ncbi:hypothetical protein N7G274_004940 [Stereocaulon virgatum]|uniref:Uncharacterized protein n=1 Tax=Stereocaulon virgatum TaxID=373712 RepID=A0ABR4A9Q8_9LECA